MFGDGLREGARQMPRQSLSPHAALHSQPYSHHSEFTHRVFPMLAHGRPDEIRETFRRKPTGLTFLEHLWNDVGTNYDPALPAEGFEMDASRLPKNRVAVVITLPKIVAPPDATHVALVFAIGALSEFPMRYFTLESAISRQGQAYTLIGEWTAHNRHQYHGQGPAADPHLFLSSIRAVFEHTPPPFMHGDWTK